MSRPSLGLVRLDHAAVIARDIDASLAFYTDVLGLRPADAGVHPDPLRPGRRRAMLLDDAGHEVIELIEMTELAHPAVPGRGGLHHLGFRLPRAAWQSLRSRLDATGYPYREVEGRLFVRDADGLILEIEHGG